MKHVMNLLKNPKITHYVMKPNHLHNKNLHHTNQLLAISNDSHTRMLSEHVCSHLPGTYFNEVQLLLLEDPVAHEVEPGQDLLGASVVHRIVHNVQCWLAVHEHLDRYSHSIFPLHLELELAQ